MSSSTEEQTQSLQAAAVGVGESPPRPTLFELFWQFMVIGAVSFGGGIIAYEQILLVEKKKWLNLDDFMATLAISQTMPGLNSVNMAVLTGDRLRGVLGAIAAGLGLIVPGAAFVLIVGIAYMAKPDHPIANLILAGIAAGATGLLAAITYKIGQGHLRHIISCLIIITTFVLMSFFKLPLIIVLLIMAPIALFIYRPR
ncbi:chromate transporter [Polynucleobacter sp. IMCC30063]|uniref:chromate transporter n=1 Tax=unclassified Polynucleobacter TaxID=2640945 RepID=UPI001F456980|nr:chromate transporter [Polynucleobacter sp. IMCC30063]MCE7528811.1 chromate transporter [Polynucleobacter sp. IMCC 29146]